MDSERDDAHRDQDLASAGVIALPDETGLIAGGMDGVYYHLNRSAMGHRDFSKLFDAPFVASFDYTPFNGHTSFFDDLNQISSTDPFTIGHAANGRTAHIHGTCVYFNNLLFVQGENNPVHVFSKSGGHFAPNPVARGSAIASIGTSAPGGMPGGILSLSANGTSNAILWANEAAGNLPSDPDSNIAPTPNILRAHDVSTVESGALQSIWDSEAEPNDRVGAATKFAPPLVANGKVYQATYGNQVVVYGPIRIRHRNWLNPHTNAYRWGDAYLDWNGGEVGQAVPLGGLGGGSPVDWTTSLAQGKTSLTSGWPVTASRMRTISGCTTGCSMWIWTASRHLTTASATGGSS